MRVRNTRNYVVKRLVNTKDDEGNRITKYTEVCTIDAYVYPGSGNVQSEVYGDRLKYILNMLYVGDEELKENDCICVFVDNDKTPDYKIISIKRYSRHKEYELEKLIQ